MCAFRDDDVCRQRYANVVYISSLPPHGWAAVSYVRSEKNISSFGTVSIFLLIGHDHHHCRRHRRRGCGR